jgi:hypothetical protein
VVEKQYGIMAAKLTRLAQKMYYGTSGRRLHYLPVSVPAASLEASGYAVINTNKSAHFHRSLKAMKKLFLCVGGTIVETVSVQV